ncbi:MAG: GyrI-like domain-containing protein [Spirochaetales bacterium]|nr:GyrI-like domain-containing protein [Spirochaetales bacterium]
MEIIEREKQPTLAVRYRTPVADLPKTMGPIYGEIAAYMGKKGIPFAGPPFAMYYNMDMNDLDVEIGFPVAEAAAGEGRIFPGTLPGGRIARAQHLGSYETFEKTYTALTAFIKEKGLETETFMYEEYLNSPEDTPPEKLATNIYFPLKG